MHSKNLETMLGSSSAGRATAMTSNVGSLISLIVPLLSSARHIVQQSHSRGHRISRAETIIRECEEYIRTIGTGNADLIFDSEPEFVEKMSDSLRAAERSIDELRLQIGKNNGFVQEFNHWNDVSHRLAELICALNENQANITITHTTPYRPTEDLPRSFDGGNRDTGRTQYSPNNFRRMDSSYSASPQLSSRPNGLTHSETTPALQCRPPPVPTHTHPESDPNIHRYSYNPKQISGDIFIPPSASELRRSNTQSSVSSSSTLHNHGLSPSTTHLIGNRQSLEQLVSTGRQSSIADPYSRHPDTKLLDRTFSATTPHFPRTHIPRSQSQDNLVPLHRHVFPAGRVLAEAGSEWGSETSSAETDQLTSASRFKSFKIADNGSSAASRIAELQYQTSISTSIRALPIYPPARTSNNTISPTISQANSYSASGPIPNTGLHPPNAVHRRYSSYDITSGSITTPVLASLPLNKTATEMYEEHRKSRRRHRGQEYSSSNRTHAHANRDEGSSSSHKHCSSHSSSRDGFKSEQSSQDKSHRKDKH